MDVYVSRADFEYCKMDTDSAYMALSADSLENIIIPRMKDQFDTGLIFARVKIFAQIVVCIGFHGHVVKSIQNLTLEHLVYLNWNLKVLKLLDYAQRLT